MSNLPIMKAKRRLKRIWVDFISLVDHGANRKTIIWKSIGNGENSGTAIDHTFKILKVDNEKRMVFGLVYSPDEVDTFGDTASAEVIEEAAHRFMLEKKQDNVDKMHNENPEHGIVVETYIVLAENSMFPDDEGAWAVGIKIQNEKTWEAIKRGDIGGLSMGAKALVEDIEKAQQEAEMKVEDVVKGVVDELRKAFVEFKWMGTVNENPETTGPSSIKDDLSSLLKEVKTSEDAATIVKAMEGFTGSALDEVKELLKEHLPDPVEPKVDKPEDIAKAISASLAETIKPLVKQIDEIGTRLETVEKAGVGRESGLPDGEQEVVAKSNGAPVPFLGIDKLD